MKKESIRKLFKFLEFTFMRKQFPMEKLRRNETANIMVNSDKFVEPEEIAKQEEIRLKDAKVSPGASNLYY